MTTPAIKPAVFTYKNYKGEVAERRVIPTRVYFGVSEHYPEPQWLMDAFCLDRQAMRTFALDQFAPPVEPVPAPAPPESFTFSWEAHRQTFGLYLQGLRAAKDLDLQSAASPLEVSVGYLNQLEQGTRDSPPSLSLLVRLSAFYGEDSRVMFRMLGLRVDTLPTVPAPAPVFSVEQVRFLMLLVRLRSHDRVSEESAILGDLLHTLSGLLFLPPRC